MAISMAISMAI